MNTNTRISMYIYKDFNAICFNTQRYSLGILMVIIHRRQRNETTFLLTRPIGLNRKFDQLPYNVYHIFGYSIRVLNSKNAATKSITKQNTYRKHCRNVTITIVIF